MTKHVLTPLAERFWLRVKKTECGCWLWTGSKARCGYGTIGLGRRGDGTAYAHRVSYELHVGPIPGGMLALHKCDVRTCVNPAHLFLGTKRDNTQDMMRKGRARHAGTGPLPENAEGSPTHWRNAMYWDKAERNRRQREYRAKRKVASPVEQTNPSVCAMTGA